MATVHLSVSMWAPGVPHCLGTGQRTQGFKEVPALCFCQLGLPVLPAKWHAWRGGHRFPASDATNFCGNSRGCVLKGPLFPQDNRSLVPWTMLFSSLARTWGQPGRCPTGHLSALGTMCQGLSEQPGLPAVHLGSGRGLSSCSSLHFLTG